MPIRIALETSITRFAKTGLSVYAHQLYHAFQSLDSTIEVALCAIPDVDIQLRSSIAKKCYAAYWQIFHARVVIPLRVKQLHCDLIHYTMTMPIPANLACPAVATVHDIIPFAHPEWMPRLRAMRSRQGIRGAIKHAQHLIADSEATRQDVLQFFGIPESKVTTVWLGADSQLPSVDATESLQIVQNQYHLQAGYVLCVGSIEPRKNLEQVIKAYALLKKKRALPPLVIVGDAAWHKSAIDTLIDKEQLRSHVKFTGHVSSAHLAALFQHAGVFVYPSLYEGFGLPPLEAMRHSCPVITSNTSSIPEVVSDAAMTIDPTDPSALADAIQTVLSDPKQAAGLRQRGQQRVTQFTWERCARETIAVYQRVLGS